MDLENEIRILRNTFAEKSKDCVNLLKEVFFYCYKYLLQFVSILELVLFSVLEVVSINNTSRCKGTILLRSMMRICHFFCFGGKAMVLLGSVTKSELCVSHCCTQTASSSFIVNI